MKNPLTAVLNVLFPVSGQLSAPPSAPPVPPAAEPTPAIKVEVPPDVAEAVALKPPLPRESYKRHNHEIEQRVKAANRHRPVMITRGMPHVRGR